MIYVPPWILIDPHDWDYEAPYDWYNESWISITELLSSIMIMGFVSIGTQYSCIVNQ